MTSDEKPPSQPCRNCGQGIRLDDCGKTADGVHLGFRWVHEVSLIPMCRITVAEPTAENGACPPETP